MTALWAALILAVMVSLIVKTARTDATIARNLAERATLRSLADAGIALTELRLLAPDGQRHIFADETPFMVDFGGHQIRISVQDQAGLVDLNLADIDMLRRLFHTIGGADEDQAEALTERLLDWREVGSGKRLNGAKARDYAAAGYKYGPREAPLESVGELSLVMGVTPALFARVEPLVTVFSQRSFVDADTAPTSLLAILPGMTSEKAAHLLATRNSRAAGQATYATQPLPLAGRSFRIMATTAATGGTAMSQALTIRLTGSDTDPFWIFQSAD